VGVHDGQLSGGGSDGKQIVLRVRLDGGMQGGRSCCLNMPNSPKPIPAGEPGATLLNEVERRMLLDLARRAILAAVAGTAPAVAEESLLPRSLLEPRACFVTLWQGNELRGCIGQLLAKEPLWEAVMKNAARAATRDHRFPPLLPAKISTVRVEISVLTSSVPLSFRSPEELLEQLRPGIDGVVLRIGETMSTFLPQVWEDLGDKVMFMEHLSRKGGHEAGAWREAGAGISVYEVEHFEEP
jgi:AmmeMemoRadiSam system protein A